MTLRVGLDVSGVLQPASGIGRYTLELCRALAARSDGPELVGMVNSLRAVAIPELGFPVHNAGWPDRVLKAAWKRLGWPPIERFVGDVDVFHASDWVHPPQRGGKSVTTVHDLGALIHPEWYDPAVVKLHVEKNRLAAERADRIIAISEHTRTTFLERFPIEPDRIRVVYNGVTGFGASTAEELAAGLRVLGLPGPYLLYVGTRERRKNLLGLLDVFSAVAREDPTLSLVVVGARPWAEARSVHGVSAWDGREFEDEIARRELTARVRILGRVSGEELRVLYSAAECFVFPSLFEGFGLPVLEAMSCGCPVVASDRSAIPEVVGDAGVLTDPDDIPGFAASVLGVLSDPALRLALETKGPRRASEFSWGRTAAETLAVYRSAVE